jgi:transporter family-2 protein
VLGGLAGAYFLASQGLAAARLGITFFVSFFAAGQSVVALVSTTRSWWSACSPSPS